MIIDANSLSLEEKVYAQLEEEILTGKLKPGEQLKEISLTKRLDASRTPIRGALHRLAEDGLVEFHANKGATVLGITPEDIEDIYAIRIKLEGLAAKLAAERISEEDKERLSSTLELSEFYLARKNNKKREELDSEFHSIIFQASASRHLTKILSDLHKNIKAYRRFSLSNPDRAEKSVAEHREIMEAILKGDAKEAEQRAYNHVENALENFKKANKDIHFKG